MDIPGCAGDIHHQNAVNTAGQEILPGGVLFSVPRGVADGNAVGYPARRMRTSQSLFRERGRSRPRGFGMWPADRGGRPGRHRGLEGPV